MFGNFFDFDVKKIKAKNRPCINKSNLKLNNHQIRVIERLFMHDGLLLVHSTGTGKTLSSIGIAECMIDNGIVENVIPGMQAAFINIGQDANAFLPFSEKIAMYFFLGLVDFLITTFVF